MIKENSKQNRIIQLDFIRVVAIVLVVLIHSVEIVYSFSLESINSMELSTRIFCLALKTIGRIGVPFFLFLTGYLLLPRHYSSMDINHFYKTHLLRLLIVY